MDLDLSSEQSELLSALEPLLARHRRLPEPAQPTYYAYGEALDRDLEAAGYYGDADGFALERADAALVLEQIARCPYAVPAMASLIVAPEVGQMLPRPIALVSSAEPTPARFLAQARTALIDAGDEVLILDLAGAEIEPMNTIFAYPYARLARIDRAKARRAEGLTPARMRDLWRLGVTCEMLGALRSAHSLTVEHVKQRVQFGRPLGTFQALHQRLAEGATHIEATGYLAARAAWSGDPADIGMAVSYAQRIAPQIAHDCHQFHGAMGVTLEYVLHHWTYRMKVLTGELGGSSANARSATRSLWGAEEAAS